MRQLVINVPDSKYSFFKELLKSLDFVNEYNEEDIIVSEKEKQLIRGRIKSAKPGNFKKWEDIKNSFGSGE